MEDIDYDSDVPRTVVVNPQNAVDDLSPADLKQTIDALGIERYAGVLVPSNIAHEKTALVKKTKCPLCTRGGSIRTARTREGLLQVTMCEVRQHNTLADCWITCKGSVYDASCFMREDVHPGGERAFVRRAGGIVDCAEDFAFHSARGRRMWAKYRIAVIVNCDDEGEGYDSSSGCIIC